MYAWNAVSTYAELFFVVWFRFDTININFKKKPDWFLEKNPEGIVPVVETSAGEVVYESSIVCEYLDEMYPEKKLLPGTPFGKAKQRLMLDQFSKVCYEN